MTRQNQVLSFYCKEQGMKAVRTIIEYGKADILKLRNFRQMARYDEFDVILVENFDVLDFSPDVTTEEIKYLNERGVNYLLNVGPDHLGRIPVPAMEILREVGQKSENSMHE